MFGLELTMYNTEGVTLGVLSYIKTSCCLTSLLGKVGRINKTFTHNPEDQFQSANTLVGTNSINFDGKVEIFRQRHLR